MSTPAPALDEVDRYLPRAHDLKKAEERAEFYKAWQEVKDQLNRRLVIAVVGTVCSGKTTAIKSLFGIDFGNISPIPGSTTEAKVAEVGEKVFVADVPGFGDINTRLSDKAKELCESTDAFVYLLNAEGGYQAQEREDLARIRSLGRPVLVVLNKIDLIREHQREELIQHQRAKIGVSPQDFMVAAFDPLNGPCINVEAVHDWLQDTLKRKGKDLQYAKVCKEKDRSCNTYVMQAVAAATAVGVLPIPGSDYLALTALQAGMITRIAHVYGCSVSSQDVINFIAQTLTGRVAREVYRSLLKLIPGAGTALAGSIAGTVTYGLGMAARAYYAGQMALAPAANDGIFGASAEDFQLRRGPA